MPIVSGPSRMKRLVSIAVGVLVLTVALTVPAWADPLGDAKKARQVGEKGDGYLGLVQANAPDAVADLVAEINRKRRERYAQIAKKNGTSVDAVAALAGAKLLGRAAAGELILKDGRWVRAE